MKIITAALAVVGNGTIAKVHEGSHRWRCHTRLISILLLGMVSTTFAANLGRGSLNFIIRNWQVEDGLPQNGVNAILQAHDGYLWIGTSSGLARFDGVKFKVYDASNTPELQTSQIMSLFEDRKGNLWIGHETGGLTRYKDGHFEPVPIHPKWKASRIWKIGTSQTGDLWLVNGEGLLYRLSDGLMLTPRAGTAVGFYSFERSADGRMWIGRNGVLSELDDGRLTTRLFDEAITNAYVQGLCPARNGGLWVVSDGRLRRWNGKQWVEDLGSCPWQYAAVTGIIELESGVLAVGTPDHGLYLIQPHGETVCFNRTNGLRSDWVRCLCEDREGNLWVGTGAAGLVMLRHSNFVTLEPPNHWQDRAVLSVTTGSDNDLWAGTDGAGLFHYHDGRWENWGYTSGISNPFVWSVSVDVPGRVWAGTWSSGLFVQQRTGFGPAPGWPEPFAAVTALLRRGPGDYWIGTGNGLLRYHQGKFSLLFPNGRNPLSEVRAILEEKDGTVWVGMSGGGLGSLQHGRVRIYRKKDGLASDFVSCLHLDEHGALWIGTVDGLSRLKNGHLTTLTTRNGLANNTICDIQDDGLGNFWISSHGGIMRVRKSELNRCANGLVPSVHVWCFVKSDGLPTQECSGGFQPAGCKTTDGWLYFPTSKGLVGLRPRDVQTNPLPPPVRIEKFLVDGQAPAAQPVPDGRLIIPPGRHQLVFQYTGLSFAAPGKVQFKYRLEGLDSRWDDAGTKRDANYSYIPPGRYSFHVIACNNDGVWNDEGASLAFTMLPFFWQTLWFRLVVIVVLVGCATAAVWLHMRRRMRGKLERLERQRAIEHERGRIARDIHDDLGASLTRIKLLSESLRQRIENSSEAMQEVERICDTTRQTSRTMDEIVWAVDPHHDSLESLVNYLGHHAQEQVKGTPIRCRLDFPIHLPAWTVTAEVRHNLFLAFKEAVNNAVKHSNASEIRISLRVQSALFALVVEDNGTGFDPEKATDQFTAGGIRNRQRHGLANMRHRLRELGGACEIESGLEMGTVVKFLLTKQEAGREDVSAWKP